MTLLCDRAPVDAGADAVPAWRGRHRGPNALSIETREDTDEETTTPAAADGEPYGAEANPTLSRPTIRGGDFDRKMAA